MANGTAATIGEAELERTITAVDRAALCVPARVLRRMIRNDIGLDLFGWRVSHRKSYVISTRAALRIADPDELGLSQLAAAELPETLILLARPEPEELERTSRAELLVRYWRLIFHGRVRIAVGLRLTTGTLSESGLRERIDQIGQADFDEIRAVLHQEDLVQDPHDLAGAYTAFAALFLELQFFEPRLLQAYFPAIETPAAMEAILSQDIDAQDLLAACRPEGAAAPAAVFACRVPVWSDGEPEEADFLEPDLWFDDDRSRFRHRLQKADKACKVGNFVRGAVLRMQASREAPDGKEEATRAAAIRTLKRMVGPLESALRLSREQCRTLRMTLPALLERASHGFWSAEARLLYDLQKVGIDQQREVHKVDLVEWALSFGKRPIKRLLPNHREVLKLRHLRSSEKRLRKVKLDENTRDRLAHVLREVIHQGEEQLRTRFRPLIARTLERSGWTTDNVPERVALLKVIEELLDPIVDHGFLSLGDLRDTISRNQLKLEDVAGPREFLRGDRLLRTDRRMAYALDGVYRRGEIYLRCLQRLSALAFGTHAGRLFTRFVALPFGGAFVALRGLQHLLVEVLLTRFGVHAEIDTVPCIVGFGIFLLGLINIASFRSAIARLTSFSLSAVRLVFRDAPTWMLNTRLLRAIAGSRAFDLTYRWGIKPFIAAVCFAGMVYATGEAGQRTARYAAVAAFATVAILLNSRLGRDMEELAVDRGLRVWQRLSVDILPGIFRLVMEMFAQALELVERIIYTIDEKLRFKTGQGRVSFVTKAILGVFWFYITYAVRIYVNLLIEPQVNPIKHFPVVTVSHKIILPLSFKLVNIIRVPFLPLGKTTANAIAAANVLLLPGVFGFLVWELKENWKLYAANRNKNLQPVLVGHHGETIARFLRPGIHSGTLPKLYSKLRRAESEARSDPRGAHAQKYRDNLHHAAAEIRHFIDRELLSLMHENPALAQLRVTSGEIHVGSNRIQVTLERHDRRNPSMKLAFEEQSGWLVASVAEPGWLNDLTDAERSAFGTALAGLYKLAGVDIVREQVAGALGITPRAYDVSDLGLVVWPDARMETEVVYNLREGPVIHPHTTSGRANLAAVDADRLLFSRRPLPWRQWVDACDPAASVFDPIGGLELLPRAGSPVARRHGRPA